MYCFAVLNLQPEGAYSFHPENDQRSVGSDGVLAGGGRGREMVGVVLATSRLGICPHSHSISSPPLETAQTFSMLFRPELTNSLIQSLDRSCCRERGGGWAWGWSGGGGHEERYSKYPPPVFSAGSRREQFRHDGQGMSSV